MQDNLPSQRDFSRYYLLIITKSYYEGASKLDVLMHPRNVLSKLNTLSNQISAQSAANASTATAGSGFAGGGGAGGTGSW